MNIDTATSEGVENEEIIGTNNPRNDAMREIAARSDANAIENSKDVYAENEPAIEPEIKPEPTEELVTIKVDGEERQVPKHLIEEAGIRALQKESTADKRLEEATLLFREAQNLRQQVPTEKLPAEDAAVTLAKAIQYGTEDQAAEAIRRLQGHASVTPEALQSFVADQIEFRDAAREFKREFKDILSDPLLEKLAYTLEDEKRRAGDKRRYAELYTEIGTELRKRFGKTPEDKLEKKADIVNIPSASARRPAPPAEKPETPSQVVEKMRAARHQI